MVESLALDGITRYSLYMYTTITLKFWSSTNQSLWWCCQFLFKHQFSSCSFWFLIKRHFVFSLLMFKVSYFFLLSVNQRVCILLSLRLSYRSWKTKKHTMKPSVDVILSNIHPFCFSSISFHVCVIGIIFVTAGVKHLRVMLYWTEKKENLRT